MGAKTIYLWPQFLGLCLVIVETLYFQQLNWSRGYLASLLFIYLTLKLVNFWGMEFFRWMGPTLFRVNPHLPKDQLDQYKEVFYTTMTEKGDLVVKRKEEENSPGVEKTDNISPKT
jgi:hypothetical protein